MICLFKTVKLRDALANSSWWTQVEQQNSAEYIDKIWAGSPWCFLDGAFDLLFNANDYNITYEVPAVLPIVCGSGRERAAAAAFWARWRVDEWH